MATRSCWHFNRCTCTPPPTSTKSKHPSSQTEKMCVETEFGSYKALVRIKLIVRLIQPEPECGCQQGLVGTSTAAPAHHLLHRQSRSIHHRTISRGVLRRNSETTTLSGVRNADLL
eukprot:scaffold41715_cov277-Skeletonema_marinoi.AAC.1